MNIIPILFFLLAGATPVTPSLVVRVLDNECRALPGMTVALAHAGQTGDRALRTTVSNASGEAIFAGIAEGKYDVLVSSENFITNRLGPLTLWNTRTLRPTVVLNLSLEWVPTPRADSK
jgi:hypothetical protein